MTLVLDAGALIQVDRGNQEVLSAIKAAFDKGEAVHVPTGVIGQAWRNPDRQALLSRTLNRCNKDEEVTLLTSDSGELGMLLSILDARARIIEV